MAVSVADLCEQHKLTIEGLTEKSGLDEQKVIAIVMGRWTPSPAERQNIAQVFDVTVDDISWGHKTPIQHIYGHGPG